MEWVTSAGGPLIVVPDAVVDTWTGAPDTFPDEEGDYGRAGAVPGYLGVLEVGGLQALVLTEPARVTFLPEDQVFLSAIAMDPDTDVRAMVESLLPVVEWVDSVEWTVTGPVVLFDSVLSGREARLDEHLPINLPPARYRVDLAPVTKPGLLRLLRLVPQDLDVSGS